MLHHDPAVRKKKHDFMLRVFDAAVLLGVNAVCGFVGRNQQRSMDENLVDFEEQFVPLLKAAKARGLTYRVEQCPMPGWTTGDNWHNNIAYTPGTWIALHRICEKHGVGDQFRIHYDPSHAILMGQDTRSIFQYLKDAGYNFLDRRLPREGPGDRREGRRRRGATAARPSSAATGSAASRRRMPADQLNAWKKQIVLAEHELPGTARHDPLAYLQNRTVDWLDHQLAARELLQLDVANTHLVVEHEYPEGAHPGSRTASSRSCRDRSRSCATSTKRRRCMFALQHEVLAGAGHPDSGHRPAGVPLRITLPGVDSSGSRSRRRCVAGPVHRADHAALEGAELRALRVSRWRRDRTMTRNPAACDADAQRDPVGRADARVNRVLELLRKPLRRRGQSKSGSTMYWTAC